MPAYQGLNTTMSGILIPRLKEIFLVTKGFNKGAAGDSMQLPLRGENGSFKYTTQEVNDVTGAPRTQFFNVVGTVPCIFSGVPLLRNLMKLSKDSIQVFAGDLNSNCYNFIAPAGTFATPTGTDFLGVGYKMTINQKERKIDVTLKGTLTDTEFAELQTLAPSYQTGGSSGTTNALTAISVPGTITRPGFKSVTVNAVNIGELQDCELVIESVEIPGNKGKIYAREMTVTLTATSLQANPTNVLGAIDHTNGNYQVIANDYADAAWTFVSGLRPKVEVEEGDKVGTIKLTMTAKYVYNTDEASPNSVDLTTATAPTWTMLGL